MLLFQVRLYFAVGEDKSSLKEFDITNFHSATSDTEMGPESDLSDTDDEDDDEFGFRQTTQV